MSQIYRFVPLNKFHIPEGKSRDNEWWKLIMLYVSKLFMGDDQFEHYLLIFIYVLEVVLISQWQG